MGKYEKRIGKIWDKFDPDKSDYDLTSFIKSNHPSVHRMNDYSRFLEVRIRLSLTCHDERYRQSEIENAIYRAWRYFMVHDKLEFLFKEAVDNYLSDWFYGIPISSTEEYDDDNIWSEKSLVTDSGATNFDEHWEQGWEWADDGDCWGNDAVKKLIWEDEYGLRRDLISSHERWQLLIPSTVKDSIEEGKKKMTASVAAYKKLSDKWTADAEAGKHDDLSRGEIRKLKPVFRHSRMDHSEPTWDVQYVCDDMWSHLDFEAIYEKNKTEDDE